MRAEERDPAYLWDMLEACRAVMGFMEGISEEEFQGEGKENEMRRLAVERELEILGEAARRVSPGFRGRHSEIPWKQLAGLRNVISHEYDKVNYGEIYRIAKGHIPDLARLLAPLVPVPPETEE